MTENKEILKLADSAISHLAKIIQVAILTGTDLIDHMRMLEMSIDDNKNIILDPEYEVRFENIINDMLNNIPKE